jgi:carboxyl-terminal processing protease
MKSINEKKIIAGFAGIIILVLVFFAGTYVGSKNTEPPQSLSNTATSVTAVDFAPFWKAWQVLNEKYVAATSTPDQEKVWGAIEGLAASYGDPYTVFFPPEEAKMFESDISGNFEGVGMEIGKKDNLLTVIAPLKDSPAAKAGIRTGDKIIRINDTTASDLSVDQAVKLIRGPKGTEVKLTILREGVQGTIEKTIMRDIIDIPTIDTEVKDSQGITTSTGDDATGLRKDGIFVIRLFSFTAQSPSLFRNVLRDFVKSGSHKLILDLRGNPGGYLEAAVDIASWFLPAGKSVVKEDFGDRGGEARVYRSKGYDVFGGKLNMVILVDGGSASASEILAGALHDHGVATLVGTKTFGKGSVQELIKITPDTSLKVTIAKWLTPNGVSISQQGIKPDYEVKITPENVQNKRDPQMDKAVELLNK